MAEEPELTPLLKASARTNTQKGPGAGPLFGAGKDRGYSAQEIARLPAAVLADRKVWRNADQYAKTAMVNRRIELIAQEFGPENEARTTLLTNMTELAKRYPHLDPDALIGLASGAINPLPDSTTGQPMSDQGSKEIENYNQIVAADVMSRIAEGTYGATSYSPVPNVDTAVEPTGGLSSLFGQPVGGITPDPVPNPKVGGLAGLAIGGTDIVTDQQAEGALVAQIAKDGEEAKNGSLAQGFLDHSLDLMTPLDNIKELYNGGMNAFWAIPEINNAVTEMSAGNEQLAAELTRRGDLTVEQAQEVFGTRGLPFLGDTPLGMYTTNINPDDLVNGKANPTDETIPIGDLSYEQVKEMWNRHLVETEQITEDGQRSFGSITGRTTLGQQDRSGTVGQGGWFGGSPADQEQARKALAERQSDIRSFEDREKSRKAAAAITEMYSTLGIDLSLDEQTNLLQARTWTEGRALTAYLHDKGVPGMSPGARAEMTISGLTDMLVTLGTDPASYIPAGAPAGAGKAALNVATKGKLFAAHTAMQATDDIISVGRTLDWRKVGKQYVLADEAGAAVSHSPALERRSFHYESETGHQVRKVGSRWEVHTPTRIAGDPDELAKPVQKFKTLKEAQESLAFPLEKVELWDEVGSTGPGKRLSEVQEEQRLAYTRATGDYTRKVSSSRDFWDFLTTSKQGAEIVNALRENTDAYDIMLRSGMKFNAELAQRLANSQSGAEVRAILAEAVGPDLRDASAISSFRGVRGGLVDAKIKLASSKFTKAMYRWGQVAPNGQPVDLADHDDIIRSAHRLGVAMGLTPDQLRPGMNKLFEYGTGVRAADYLLGDFMETIIFDNLRQAGVRPERINELKKLIRRETGEGTLAPVRGASQRAGVAQDWEEAAAQAMETRYAGGILLDDTVANGQYARGINEEASLMGHEVLASHVLLPTAREIRRDVTSIAKIMRKGQHSEKAYEIAAKGGAQILDRWRNITLMNVPYLMRAIGEEMFSQAIMGRGGMLHNPVSTLGSIIMLHHMLESSSGFRILPKAIRAARAATGAQRRAIVRPDEYRGARMVDTQDVINSLSLPRDTFQSAVGRSGREVGWEKFERQTREGIINPIIIEVDSASKRVKVADGMKRLVAADRNNLDSVPIIIKPGRVSDEEGSLLTDTMLQLHGTQADEVMQGSRDVTHELLFRPSSVRGDITDVVMQARRAVEDSVAHRLALKYVAPWMSTHYARINGQTWGADIERAVRAGDNRGLSQKFRLLTYAQGSAMLDEHPNKMKFRGLKSVALRIDEQTGKIDWTDADSISFLMSQADTLAEIASVREVRDILSGARNLDDIVRDTLDDPRRVDDILSQMQQNTTYSVNKVGQRFPEGMDADTTVAWYDRARAGDLDAAIRTYYQDMLNNVSQHLGKNMSPRVRRAVETGQWAGKPIGQENKKFREMLRDELDNNPDFRDSIPHKIESVPDRVNNVAGMRWTQKFFEMVGNVRDMSTLHPLIRQEYVKEIARIAPYMTPEAHAEQLRWVSALGDKKLTKALQDAPPSPNGFLDAEDVDALADKATRAVVEDTFYNAVNRQNWAVAVRWAAPFAQAAASSTRRWGKGMMIDPTATYRTVRNIEGMQAALGEWTTTDDDLGGIRESAGVTGHMDENEFGDEMFVYPAFGRLASIASALISKGVSGEADPIAATATTKSIDVFSGGLFTAMGGPAVTMILTMTPLRAVEARSDVIGDVARFMQPYGIKQDGSTWQKVGSAFVPAKWTGLILENEKMINDMSKAIMISRLSSGEYGPASEWTHAQSEQIRADVNRDARTLIWLEAAGKLGLPALGGFDFTPLIEMPKGKNIPGIPAGREGVQYLLPHMAKAEYDRYMKDADEDQRATRQAVFLKDWGEFFMFLNYGTTKSTSGITYSNPDAAKFAREEPQLYREHRDSIGMLLPGGDWDADYDSFDKALTAQDKARGIRQERSTADQWEFLRQKALAYQKGQERADLVRAGADEATIRRMNRKYDDLGLKFADPGWVSGHLQNLREMLNDEAVLDAVPSAKYVKQYIQMRDKTWEALNQRGIASFSSDEALNTPEVAWLYATGSKAAADDKGFRTFWEQVGSQEFESED